MANGWDEDREFWAGAEDMGKYAMRQSALADAAVEAALDALEDDEDWAELEELEAQWAAADAEDAS